MYNSRLLLNNLSEAIVMIDRDGYIQYANTAASSFTGFAPDELHNKSIYIFYNNDDRIKAEYELSVAFKKGKFISEGWRFKSNNERFWFEMTITPIIENNIHIGYTCVLRDASEKKKQELALRESEERYRLMVDNVKDYAIFMLDPQGYIMTWNEGAKKHKGYNASEIIGQHFSIFYTTADIENKKPELELVVAKQTEKYEEEGWRVKKNGSVFWASVVLTALFNEQNELVGYSKVTRDLTEKKHNEEALRQSEERYRSLVEQVTDYGIFMMDEKGRIVSWNEGAKRIKGYTRNEIVGKYFSIFYPEEDIISGKPAMELREAIATGKYEEEGWRLRKDGSKFWANVVITAVYNDRGHLSGFSKVTRDLTQRKEAERELRESHDRFRALARELKHTNNELSYANEELEQFTSIVSHDLQEPIRTIKSFLQLIELKLNESESAELKKYISKSVKAANRMKELIQNLLHYSQLSRGEIVEENVDVKALIGQAMQNLRKAVDMSGASITIENNLQTVNGDRVQLVQLVQNLVGNSLKFVNGKKPEIKITCTSENRVAKFGVSDNGIGIATDDMPKVFEIFKRLDTKNEYPGTGIGLAICKKIVDRHGGSIWPESEPGKGTTFYFTLNESRNANLTA